MLRNDYEGGLREEDGVTVSLASAPAYTLTGPQLPGPWSGLGKAPIAGVQG